MKKLIGLIIVSVLVAVPLCALDECPEKMQAVLLLKIIPFVRNFSDAPPEGGINIGVYGTHDIYGYLESAAKKVNFKTNFIPVPTAETSLENLHIIYIPRGNSPALVEKINSQAKKYKILTAAGDPGAVLDANITMSFYVKDEKPKILINMKSAKEEGIQFSSKILDLADLRYWEKGSGPTP